ncbi:TonB-dependent receptor domain-containing protein [Sphingosinicella sp. CPCC 101087]|uniref:TonB-dependent receptor domain-containing protein n=1 Tax=Sphingosinicella sp. CPCC 101087 TaxID=2497754 RepID=UPI00101D96D3|nr:TonB-dependent receptor [Sphingosinicella sp. CPCC 101087]
MRSANLIEKAFLSASTLAISVAAVPGTALAQDEAVQPDATTGAQTVADDMATDQQTVVVTGSRIARANFDTPQPAVVLGSEQIELRGYTNLGDALDELPAFGLPGNNPVGGQSGAFGSGQSFVNFFGLGDQRTLTVVNGRRFVSSNTSSIFGPTGAGSQVDFNIFPTMLVDRVETIAVGGAPIYGSDAIAGTVNVITKRDFEGIMLDAQAGISELGDAPEYRLGALAGLNFGGGRGNITVALEYNRQDGLVGESRPGEGLGRFFTTCLPSSEFDQCLIEDRRIPALSAYGVPLVTDGFPLSPAQAAGGGQPSVTDAAGNPLGFDAAGNLVPINFGEQTGNLINFNGGNGFALPENLLAETRRYLGAVVTQYQITDNLRAFGEFWYANSRGRQLRDQPVYNTGLFDVAGGTDGNLILSIDNPFLSPAARAAIQQSIASNPVSDQNLGGAPQDYFYLGRANTDIIPSDGYSTVELWRVVGGIDGDFELFGRGMRFEVVGNYGKSVTKGRERVLVQQNFENAINAVTDANGNIVCAPGGVNAPIATISSQCFPINPFGNQIDQRAIDYITTFADPRAENDQLVATASISGSLFDIWGGPVGFAIGYEHREESSEFDPGAFYFGLPDPDDPDGGRTQFGRSIPIDPVSGEFNTDEFFGELTVPLIGRDQNIPLIYSLELNGAFRYIDHSLAGGDPTWTVGATWQPIQDITFRGNFTRSVRAPAVTELFNPTSQIFTTADDPCDSRFLNAGPNPATRQANCAADGLPANFQSNIVDFTTRGTLQGNTELANEKADAWTVGAVVRPRFLPGLTLAVDWVDIELEGAIQSLNAEQTLQACYDDPSFPSAICDQFTRDAQGQITFIQTGFANAASRSFAGLVAELQWRIDTPFLGSNSAVNLGVNYLYNDELEFRVGQGDLTTLRNSVGYSKHQFTTNLTYSNEGLRAQLQAQYIGPTLIDPDAQPGTYDVPRVGDVVFFNTSLSYDVSEQFQVRFIVDNVLDTDPPFPAPTGQASRVTYFDGILGRYFKVGARVRF